MSKWRHIARQFGREFNLSWKLPNSIEQPKSFWWFWWCGCLSVPKTNHYNSIKTEVETRHACVVKFRLILYLFMMDFGRIMLSKINQTVIKKRIQKQCEERRDETCPRNSTEWLGPLADPLVLRCGEGVREGINPSLTGLKTDYANISHLSPKGWWDYDSCFVSFQAYFMLKCLAWALLCRLEAVI